MASEFQKYCERYSAAHENQVAHVYKFIAFEKSNNWQGMRCAANDLIDFWNQLCEICETCFHRLGRKIPVETGQGVTMGSVRQELIEDNHRFSLGRTIAPVPPHAV